MASDIWFYISVFVFSSGILTQGQEEPSIYFLHVRSDIRYRYATTLVTSKVVNPAQVSREVLFEVTLPDEAFITNFTLNINGLIYIGEVKEKEEARQQYEQAKSKGQSSGHISVKPRHANIFNMAVNVEAMGKVIFNLTYEERVTRKLGKYRHVIYINPGQPVEDFQIELSLLESREITSVKVLPIQNDILTNKNTETDESNDMAIILRPTAKSAYILYNSSLEDQTRRDPSGISGQFVVEYNVDRQTNAGDLLVVNGYFVHYFDFDDIEPFSKDMVFLLDVSDSMRGRKLEQLKAAMFEILDDVHENDRLNIITFSSSVRYWKGHQLIRATKENINSAKKFIKNFHAHESTNIDLAMKSGIQLLSQKSQNQRAPVLIFLTDGRATVGEILPDNILNNVLTWNEGAIPIFSLSFGEKGDYNFVRRVAAQNNGFGRKIFEDSDADLQIKGFYDEIATVLLKNLTFTYLNTSVDKESLTQLKFNTYFVGSEILVAGKLTNGESNSITVSVSSASLRGFIQLNNVNNFIPHWMDFSGRADINFESLTEKLWAYLTIKQNLKLMEASTNLIEKKRIKEKTLQLSLKYSFVTPFTSMVVTLPNATETQSLENSFEDTAIPPRTGFVAKKSHVKRNKMRNGGKGLKSPQIKRRRNGYIDDSHFFHAKANYRDKSRGQKSRIKKAKGRRRKKAKQRHARGMTIPSFIIKITGIMEPICIDAGLSAPKTYNLLQHSDSGTLIYASTNPNRQVGRRRKRKRKHQSAMISRVTMETGGQSLTFLPTKYSLDGRDVLWDTDTFALNILNQNISFTVDVIPTNGSRSHGDEQLQIYSDISSYSGRLDGLLALFTDVSGTVVQRKTSRGRRFAKINLKKGPSVYKLRRVQLHINPSNVIGSCWSIKKNVAKLLGVRPKLFENGSVL